VLVAKNGKILLGNGYGMANYDFNIPNTTATKFRIGSLTKAFTAVMVLQLVESGKIKLDEKIKDYLPDYPNANRDSITIHQLLSHKSGMPHYEAIPDFFEKYGSVYLSEEDYINLFSNLPLLFIPGTKYKYSSFGYFLLGAILEKVSGKSYKDLLREKITIPLAMKNTTVENNSSIEINKASGYDYLFDYKHTYKYTGLANSPYEDVSKAGGAGQILSTVEDLYKWNIALSSNKLLSEKYSTLLFKPNLSNYAYGWNIKQKSLKGFADKVTIAEHGGSSTGFLSYISKNLTNGDFIVVLSNRSNAAVQNMTEDIQAILYGDSYKMPIRALLPDSTGNITFKLKGFLTAKTVFVSGEFNNWIPWQTFLTRQGDEWLCKVHLNKGTYKYMFVVDGKWIPDPDNPLQDKGSFTSSLITVD
ncbi:MAG: serine hydrolase, partial [Chitinophagaceae bacterium]